jgi:hypothetical protein
MTENPDALPNRIDAIERKLDALSASVDRRFDDVNTRFDDVNVHFGEQRTYTEFASDRLERLMTAGFERVERSIAAGSERLERLERKLDQFIDFQSRATRRRRPLPRPKKN